eukprot:jgi/Ulvmu1/11999/UM083_0011.1
MIMQNWTHVETIFQALNAMPKQQHDTNIMRVRPYFLENCAKMYRQTVVLSSFEAPELNVLTSGFCNHEGMAKISCKYDGVLHRVIPRAHHLFEKIPAESPQHAAEQRFHHFAKHVWTRVADARSPGVLLFVSSYFDFVRVRNFLKAQGASFSVYCEYTAGSDVLRARSRFAKQERKVLLYTERAHFYFRPTLRGVNEVVFYSLPQHAEFYQELVDMAQPRAADLYCPVQAVVSKFDFLAMKRIIGDRRAKVVIASEATSVVFKTEQ